MDYGKMHARFPEQDGNFAPCFAFSVHKCGSTLLEVMIDSVCRRAGIPAVSVPGLMFREGHLDTDWGNDIGMKLLFQKRLLYFGFRFLPDALTDPEVRLNEKRFTLLVRDPRDALVSQYFSFGKKSGSHVVPPKNPEAFKAKLAAQGDDLEIDEYVIASSQSLCEKLSHYRDNLNFDLGLVARYEDVFFDKEMYLDAIFKHFGIDVAPDIIRSVAKANDIRPKHEDDTKHIRKGTPGDHREKLRSDTIDTLNNMFREIGAFFGYTL